MKPELNVARGRRFTEIDWSLYAIIDKKLAAGRRVKELTEALIAGGAGIIQLRNKDYHSKDFYDDALAAKEVTGRESIPLIINDRIDIALAVDADGVHLGQQDLPVAKARRLLGPGRMIGVSVHSVSEFRNSQAGKPDYYGVGTVYSSQTKQGLSTAGTTIIEKIRAETDLPMVAIGGITPANLAPVFRAGADGVAAISALLNSDKVRDRAAEFIAAIGKCKTSL